MIGRRGFLTGLGALFAAPAIVRVASLMPVSVMPEEEVLRGLARSEGNLCTIEMIIKEAIRQWKNSNAFIQHVDARYAFSLNEYAEIPSIVWDSVPSVLSPV